MNLLLLCFEQVGEDGVVLVTGRQAKHLLEILKVVVGSTINVGIDDLWVGSARVLELFNEASIPVSDKLSSEPDLPSSQNMNDLTINEEDKREDKRGGRDSKELARQIKRRRAQIEPTVKIQLLHPNGLEFPNSQFNHESIAVNRCHFGLSNTPVPLKPKRPLIDLLIALPRPRSFDRILQTAATMGVGRIIFTPTSRVEIAYFSSPKLSVKSIEEALRLGLEQSAVDPFFPEVHIFASWQRCLSKLKSQFIIPKSNVPNSDVPNSDVPNSDVPNSDESTNSNTPPYYHSLIAFHPDSNDYALDHPSIGIPNHNGPVLLALGPEGGFLDFEVDDLRTMGFKVCQMGNRIMRLETAVVAAMAQVQLLMSQNSKPVPNRTDLEPSIPIGCWCGSRQKYPHHIELPIKGRRDQKI